MIEKRKGNIDWGSLAILVFFVGFAGFCIYIFVNSLINPTNSRPTYGIDCEEEWGLYGRERVCDIDGGYDLDREPEGYEEYLEQKEDEYRQEKEAEALEEAEERYWEQMYGE